MPRRCLLLLLVLGLIVAAGQPVLADWSGSQTITLERDRDGGGLVTIYTGALNYEARNWLHITAVIDAHPALGVDGDLSVTAYLLFGRIIYLTAGVRVGVWHSARPPTPYLSVSYTF